MAAQENWLGFGVAAGRHLKGWGRSVGGYLTVPLPLCPLQSGQVYYINDGESVNLFEWMAPLVGAQMPTSTLSENLGVPMSSLPVILS